MNKENKAVRIGVIPPLGLTFEVFFKKENCFFAPGLLVSPWYETKEILSSKGYELVEYRQGISVDAVLCYSVGWRDILRSYPEKVIYIVLEPPAGQPLHAKQYLKRISRVMDVVMSPLNEEGKGCTDLGMNVPYCFDLHTTSFAPPCEKKLLVNISSNKTCSFPGELYSKRLEVIRFFETHHSDDFDFYGLRWSKERYGNLIGACHCKFTTMQKYKFAICFANCTTDCNFLTKNYLTAFWLAVCPFTPG